MATDSTQAGFLAPLAGPPYDQALDDVLNPTFAGITGLDGDNYVRPRYQPNPPVQPDRTVDWLAFGVNRNVSDNWAAQEASATQVKVIRYQEMERLLSFYGPNAAANGECLRDGLQIDQNRALMNSADIGVVSIGELRRAPALFKEQWLSKWDMTLVLRRRTERTYPILSLLSAGFELRTDPIGETPITFNLTLP